LTENHFCDRIQGATRGGIWASPARHLWH